MTNEPSIAEDGTEGAVRVQAEIQPTTPRSLPGSFKVLVAIYILIGSHAVISGVISVLQGSFYVEPTVLSLAVGIGLLLRKRPWRVVGMLLNMLVLAGYGVFSFVVLSSWAAYKKVGENIVTLIGERWSTVLLYGSLGLSILVCGFCVWGTYLLTRQHIRELFQPTKSPISSFATLLVLLVMVTVVRETGGLNLNLCITQFNTSTSSFGQKSSHADFRVAPPVIVDVNSLNSESIVVMTKLNVTKTSRSWQFERYTGLLAAMAKEKYQEHAQKVHINVSHVNLKGDYWLPLAKTGSASFKATTRGTGELSAYDSSLRGTIEFSVYGFCSVHSLRQKLQNQVGGIAFKKFTKSAGVP